VKQIVPQGVEGMVPYRGSLSEVLCQFIGGLRYSLGYCGTKTIPELRARAKVTRVSPSALKEAHPHDIIMTRDAPNYMQEN
ncbi:MAG: IMP dehydrogenase, partial [Lentisphaeria bacterium]|jgi:IMP dehydrogenase|nr:IMP dehydrogenase [Lentisphaeria bacterium]